MAEISVWWRLVGVDGADYGRFSDYAKAVRVAMALAECERTPPIGYLAIRREQENAGGCAAIDAEVSHG